MKKKIIIIAVVVVIIVAAVIVMGLSSTTLSSMSDSSSKVVEDQAELESGNFYVKEGNSYKKADFKDYTFKGKEINEDGSEERGIFFNVDEEDIPTVTSQDELLYISKTDVPQEFIFERFRDDGISIGLANLIKDESNHYYFPLNENDDSDYESYVDMESDVKAVTKLENVSRLYIDQVGDIKVNPDTVTKGGVIKGLESCKEYIATFYTGTLYQDFKVNSNIHTFTSMESIKSYDYDFLHSNVIRVKIPEYFKSGYYLVNGIGFFRYLKDSDIGRTDVFINDPMIIYDEYGFVVYDPSDESYKGISQEQAVQNSNIHSAEPGGE